MDYLFRAHSNIHRNSPIRIFGVRRTQFLVYSDEGWLWVNQKNFTPLGHTKRSWKDPDAGHLLGVAYTGQR